MIHALITLVFCILVVVFHLPLYCCAYPVLWYMGREFTQAEYRYIATYGDNKRSNMPWWGGFYYKVWNLKSFTDWFLPLVVSCVFVTSYYLLKKYY